MASERKRIANYQNAQKSTGPRTEKGKRTSSQNALTHGLLGHAAVLPGEDESFLDELRWQFTADLAPVGALETMWVDIIVTTLWKLRRINRLEQGIFVHHEDEPRVGAQMCGTIRLDVWNERAEAARVLIRDTADGNQLEKLSRYEMRLQQQLRVAYHELERLQAARKGVSVASPVAVDVTVSASEIADPLSKIAMPVDAAPSTCDETGDACAAGETARAMPGASEANDLSAPPIEAGVPMGHGGPGDLLRNEPTKMA
jgi:hypothetical protein